MQEFQITRDRDAYFVYRGYGYQVDLTIFRWLNLGDGEELQLEFGEDIDIVTRALCAPAEEKLGCWNRSSTLTGKVTLNTDGVKSAIANAVEHFSANSTLSLQLRFFTNAEATVERLSPFPKGVGGVQVWERIRKRECSTVDRDRWLAGIRAILQKAKKPNDFNDGNLDPVQRFLKQATQEQLLRLVESIELCAGGPSPSELKNSIRHSLVSRGFSPHRQHAAELHARLYLHLFGVLSQPGRKVVTTADLTQCAQLPSLGEYEQSVLNSIVSNVFELELRVDALESTQHSLSIAMTATQLKLNELAGDAPTLISLSKRLPELSLTAPPLVQQLCQRTTTVTSLLDELHLRTWTALHGSTGTGKTQLSLLTANELGSLTMHLSLEGLDCQQSLLRLLVGLTRLANQSSLILSHEAVESAIRDLGSGSLIVIDDLPQIVEINDFGRMLVAIAAICRRYEVLLLTTSHHMLPSNLLELVDEDTVNCMPVPPFANEDAAELFQTLGAPSEFLHSGTVELLCAVTSGNPALLKAYAQFCVAKNWVIEPEVLNQFRDAESVSRLLNQTVRRLLASITDNDSREVLYRLCLVSGTFGWNEVQRVANVNPGISRSRERLSLLVGQWVEQRSEGQMTVSPLVKPLASELDETVIQDVNRTLADLILSEGSLDLIQVLRVAGYLSLSNDFNRLGIFLFKTLLAAESLPKPSKRFLVEGIFKPRVLPNECSLSIRLLVTSRFILLADELEQSTNELLVQLEEIIKTAEEADSWAIYCAALSVAAVASKTDFQRSLRFAFLAIERHDAIMDIASTARGDDAFSLDRSLLVWFCVTGIKTNEDLLAWIEFLECLPPEVVIAAFALDHAQLGSKAVVDQPWMAEAEKDESSRDWTSVIGTLNRVAEFAEFRKIEILWASSLRAIAIIQAEYQDDLTGAVQAVQDWLQHDLAGEQSRLMLGDIVGKQFLRIKDAVNAAIWFEIATSSAANSPASVRVSAFLGLARSVGDADPNKAINLCQAAVDYAESDPDNVHELEFAAALAELGLSQWLTTGHFEEAFISLNRAARLFDESGDKSRLWKERFVAFGNYLGYLTSVADRGIPLTKTLEGDGYTAPFRGCFVATNPAMAKHFDETDYGVRSTMLLPAMMSMFAESVGQSTEAIRWAESGLSAARQKAFPETLYSLGQQIFPVLIEEGRIYEGVDLAYESCSALVALNERRAQNLPKMVAGVQIAETLGPIPNEKWAQAERWTMEQAVVPAVLQIGRQKLRSDADAVELAKQLIDACREIGEYASEQEEWRRIADLVKQIFIDDAPSIALHRLANSFGDSALGTIGYLGCTLVSDAELERSLIHHSIVYYRLEQTLPASIPAFAKIACPFLTEYWQSHVTDQAFRLTAPHEVKRSLDLAVESDLAIRAKEVLRAVRSGIYSPWPQNLAVIRDWINDTHAR